MEHYETIKHLAVEMNLQCRDQVATLVAQKLAELNCNGSQETLNLLSDSIWSQLQQVRVGAAARIRDEVARNNAQLTVALQQAPSAHTDREGFLKFIDSLPTALVDPPIDAALLKQLLSETLSAASDDVPYSYLPPFRGLLDFDCLATNHLFEIVPGKERDFIRAAAVIKWEDRLEKTVTRRTSSTSLAKLTSTNVETSLAASGWGASLGLAGFSNASNEQQESTAFNAATAVCKAVKVRFTFNYDAVQLLQDSVIRPTLALQQVIDDLRQRCVPCVRACDIPSDRFGKLFSTQFDVGAARYVQVSERLAASANLEELRDAWGVAAELSASCFGFGGAGKQTVKNASLSRSTRAKAEQERQEAIHQLGGNPQDPRTWEVVHIHNVVPVAALVAEILRVPADVPPPPVSERVIVVVGDAGTGKSTLINGMLGTRSSTGAAAAGVTKRVEWHTKTIDGVPLKVYDTPGIGDADIKLHDFVKMFNDTFAEKVIHELVFTVSLLNPRVSIGQQVLVALLSKYAHQGNPFSHLLVIGTFADATQYFPGRVAEFLEKQKGSVSHELQQACGTELPFATAAKDDTHAAVGVLLRLARKSPGFTVKAIAAADAVKVISEVAGVAPKDVERKK